MDLIAYTCVGTQTAGPTEHQWETFAAQSQTVFEPLASSLKCVCNTAANIHSYDLHRLYSISLKYHCRKGTV